MDFLSGRASTSLLRLRPPARDEIGDRASAALPFFAPVSTVGGIPSDQKKSLPAFADRGCAEKMTDGKGDLVAHQGSA